MSGHAIVVQTAAMSGFSRTSMITVDGNIKHPVNHAMEIIMRNRMGHTQKRPKRAECNIVTQTDERYCSTCNLRWDINDEAVSYTHLTLPTKA